MYDIWKCKRKKKFHTDDPAAKGVSNLTATQISISVCVREKESE